MKRYVTLILCLILTFAACVSTTSASADTMYANSWIGNVISTTCSIRESPDTRATRLFQAKNLQELTIVGEYYDWFIVDCYQSGLSSVPQNGYVLKLYVKLGGYYITVNDQVKLYVDPWGTPLNNGQKAKSGETMFVISETSEWLCCQLKTEDRQPGSCFIRKSDIGYVEVGQQQQTVGYYDFSNPSNYPRGYKGTYSGNEYTNYIATWKIPVSKGWSVGIREVPDKDTKCLIIIHSGDLDYYGYSYIKVNVIYNLGQYAYVRIDDPKRPGGFVEGYVQCKFFEAY